MANDVYTVISYSDNKRWMDFTKQIEQAEVAYIENHLLIDGMKLVEDLLFSRELDEDNYVDKIGSKWCNLFQIGSMGRYYHGSYLETHSAWCSPTGLLQRIVDEFGADGLSLRIEDNDWGILGDVQYKNGSYQTKGLSANYYQKFIASLKVRNTNAKIILSDTSFYNDECLDRYEAVDFINPISFGSLEDVVYSLSCFPSQEERRDYEWKFDKRDLLNGLSCNTLREIMWGFPKLSGNKRKRNALTKMIRTK